LDKTTPKRIGYLEIKLRQFAAFLVTFFAVEKSDWLSGHPDDLELKNQIREVKYQNMTLPLKYTHKTLASRYHSIRDDLELKT